MIIPRTTSKGERRYQVRVNNRSHGTFATLKEARAAEREAFQKPEPVESIPIESLVTRYYDLWVTGKLGKKPKPGTVRYRDPQFRTIKTYFAGRPIHSITPTEAEDFAVAHPSATTVASMMFRYAVSRKLVAHNEFAQHVPKEGDGRKYLDPLTDQQVYDLEEIVGEHFGLRMAAMVPFWAYSGLRSTELYNVDWPDIDWDAGEIVVRDGKTGPRRALLLDPAREAIEPFRGIGPVFVTPGRGKRFTLDNMQRYTAKIHEHFDPHPNRPFDWYELRHFNAHLLYARRGFPSQDVAEHLGNSPEEVERRYGHFRVGAINRMKAALEDQGIPREAKKVVIRPTDVRECG